MECLEQLFLTLFQFRWAGRHKHLTHKPWWFHKIKQQFALICHRDFPNPGPSVIDFRFSIWCFHRPLHWPGSLEAKRLWISRRLWTASNWQPVTFYEQDHFSWFSFYLFKLCSSSTVHSGFEIVLKLKASSSGTGKLRACNSLPRVLSFQATVLKG